MKSKRKKSKKSLKILKKPDYTECTKQAKFADLLERNIYWTWMALNELLDEIVQHDKVAKSTKRVKLLLKILQAHTEELSGLRTKQMITFLLELCPELEKPLREYLKVRKAS